MPVDLGSAYGSIEIGTERAEQSIQSLAASLRGTGTAMSAAFTLPLVGIATSAAGMRSLLDGAPGLRFVHRRMDVGTEVVLERCDDARLRLAVARADRAPGPEELATFGEAFGVPAGCEWGGRRPSDMG